MAPSTASAGARIQPCGTAPARLRSAQDIRTVLRHGRARSGSSVVVRMLSRDDDEAAPRVAVVAGRKVGAAVARNRVKRRLRAAAREAGWPCGTDVVLIGRADALRTPFATLVEELTAAGGTRP